MCFPINFYEFYFYAKARSPTRVELFFDWGIALAKKAGTEGGLSCPNLTKWFDEVKMMLILILISQNDIV
jgi:hypothetical protein